jgi:hypothetical protein
MRGLLRFATTAALTETSTIMPVMGPAAERPEARRHACIEALLPAV